MLNAFYPQTNCKPAERAVSIFTARILERNLRISPDGYPVFFDIKADMNSDEFTIADKDNGAEIVSGGLLGLIHGAGFFLRMTVFFENSAEPANGGETKNRNAPSAGHILPLIFIIFTMSRPLMKSADTSKTLRCGALIM